MPPGRARGAALTGAVTAPPQKARVALPQSFSSSDPVLFVRADGFSYEPRGQFFRGRLPVTGRALAAANAQQPLEITDITAQGVHLRVATASLPFPGWSVEIAHRLTETDTVLSRLRRGGL